MDAVPVERHVRQRQPRTRYSRVPTLLRTQQQAITICGATATTDDLSWADARGVAAREWITCADCLSAMEARAMTDKESAEYGFMATLDGHGLCVTDSNGGGTRYSAYSRTEVAESIAGYIRLCADMLADCMADDLFDDDADDGSDDEG